MRLASCGLTAALFLVQLTGCDFLQYEPSGEYEVDFTPPTVPAIDVDFDAADDTLGAWGRATFAYHFDLDGRTYAETVVYLDGAVLLTTHDPAPFIVDTRTLTDGAHSFVIEVRAHSGTGSLADRLGAEIAFVRREKVLVVDNAPPQALAVREVRPAEGRLRVTWEPYRRYNFQSYVLYRTRGFTGHDGEVVWLEPARAVIIDDASQTTWLDSTYIGDPVRYHVEVRAADVHRAGSATPFYSPPPSVSTTSVDGTITLTWSRSRFPANFDRYEITRMTEPYYQWTRLAIIDREADTSFVDRGPHPFGRTYRYQVTTVATSDHSVASAEHAAWPGTRAPLGELFADLFMLPHYVPAHDAYLARTETSLLLLDGSTHAVQKSHPSEGAVAPTPDGTIYTTADRRFELRTPVVRQLDPITLMPAASYDLGPVLGTDRRATLTAATDAKRIFLRVEELKGYATYCCAAAVVDLDPLRLVALFGSPEQPAAFVAVSPQGRYALVDHSEGFEARTVLYAAGDGDLEEVRALPHHPVYDRVAFIEDDRLAVQEGGTVYVYRLPDLRLERTFDVAANLQHLTYDPMTGYLAGTAGDAFVAYTPADGHLVATVDVDLEHVYTLTNGTLWSSNGFARPLRSDD